MMNNDSDLTGKVLGTCTLKRLIGRGGMGAVYLAQQSRPIRRVAVKVLLPNILRSGGVYHEFLVRFQREANLIAQLEHINIVPIFEYGEQDGLTYLVMPHLTGGSLRDLLAQRGKLSLNESLMYIDQAAAALDYAHAHGIIHRDLKPANFLLYADGRLVLADFGIARMMQDNTSSSFGSTLTGTGMFVGTPEYMAPEMLRGEPVDHLADIYELGIVLFQMLSGTVPFKGNTPLVVATQHMQEPLPLLHAMDSAIPLSVDAVLQRATAKRPQDRFITAGALTQSLRVAIHSQSFSLEDESNIATVMSSPQSNAPHVITPQYQMPPIQQVIDSTPGSQRSEPPSSGFSPTLSDFPITPPRTQRSLPSSTQPWLIFIGLLLVIILVIGGILVGLQLNKGGTNLSTGAVTTSNGPSSPFSTTPSVSTSAQSGVIPKGKLLYSTPIPGVPCDKNGGVWTNYNQPVIVCQPTFLAITNTYTPSPNIPSQLVGTFLQSLPNLSFPANYVVEAQLQQASSSSADFGLYFRNQPGNEQGVYTFLIHPDGSWSSYVYDNTTGNPTQIVAGGTVGSAYSSMKVDILVNGANFTFYVNDKLVGNAYNTQYSAGTVGIAVQAGGTVNVSNFALLATQ